MQQVAAINSDIASPGIHANNASQQSSDGMGDDFAQFLNSSHQQSGSEFRGHENRGTSAVHGSSQNNGGEAHKTAVSDAHEPQKDATDNTANSAATQDSDAQPQSVNKQSADETGKSVSEKGSERSELALSGNEVSSDAEQSSEEDPHHEQWISILQQLNGESSGSNAEIEASDIVVQHTVATDDQKPPLDEIEMTQDVVEAENVSGLEQWKQELREKMLNYTGELSASQNKDMEKRLAELSEEDIQQLLNDDRIFREMAGSILNTEQPQPGDVALLLMLAEHNLNESGDSEPNSELIDGVNTTSNTVVEVEDSEGVDSESTASQGAGSEGTGSQGAHSEGTSSQIADSEGDEIVELETISSGTNRNEDESDSTDVPDSQLHDALFNGVDVDIKATQDDEKPTGTIPEPEVNLTGNTGTVDANSKASHEQNIKPEALDLKQLLSDLEQNLASSEEKIIAVENLTKRIESADVGKTPAGQKFLESLKNTLQEYKSQLKEGHEPAINLNKMVTDAMVGDSAQADALAMENQMKQALQQMVNVAQAHQSLDSGARESLLSTVQSGISASNLTRESNASQVELAKTQQAQNQAQVMEKAVNIMKPEAAQDLANKVQVMMSQRNMVADIRLDPPDLGQMQIKITIQGDSASVSMVVQSQAAREALEHNQPRLKELLEQQGIELGQSSVREEGRGEAGQGEKGEMASGDSVNGTEDVDGNESGESYITVDEPEGIDYFA